MSIRHGNCNFRNLEFNTVCGCQEFTPEEDDDGAPSGLASSGGRARKTCLCGHFVNFHTKHLEESREQRKQAYGESFRSARLRSGATSPTSIVALANAKQTPATQPVQDFDEPYTLSKTFEDPVRYQPNPPGRILAGSFGGETGLGISLRTNRDIDRSNGGRSGDSSAVTEIAPHLAYMPGRYQGLLGEPRREQQGGAGQLLRSARSSPLLGHQPTMQQLNSYRGPADDATIASTVADSQIITGQDRYLEFDKRVNGALHMVRGLSQAFLPIHLQEGIRLHTPGSARDNSPLIAFDEREPLSDELQRQTLAIEAQLRDLARAVAGHMNTGGTMDEEPRNRIEELPQSLPTESPVRQQTLSSPIKSPSDKVTSAPQAPPSSPPPPSQVVVGNEVALTSETSIAQPVPGASESFVNKKIHEINEKVDLQEEMCNDVIKFKNDTEEEIAEMGANVFTLEERLNNMENQFQRYLEDREQSFRKRSRDDEDEGSGNERKKRRRRRRETDLRTPSSVDKTEKNYSKKVARGSEVNQLEGTFKQTLTTTTSFTRTHSTSTSFTSASSCSTSTRLNQTALIKSLSNQIGVLQQRLQQVEAVAAPSLDRPWIVQVVVLPQSTWTTWRCTKDSQLVEQQRAPRALQQTGRAWKRLHSRGLIKCLEVTGGEARDMERAIRKAFSNIFSTLYESTDSSAKEDGPFDWSPLRKAPEQITLRALTQDEMSKQFWKVDFLRGTCAEDLGPSTPSPRSSHVPSSDPPSKSSQVPKSSPIKNQISVAKPTHRLYITNCWTATMGASWDATRDNTQVSSANSKRRAGSVLSTQPSSLGVNSLRLKSRVDARRSLSPKLGGNEHSYRSGWSDIRNLPPETVYIHDSKHEIASLKPRPAEDEAFWYYDPCLDGPREDGSSSGDGSVSDTAQEGTLLGGKDDFISGFKTAKSSQRATSQRREHSQRSQRAATQMSVHELANMPSHSHHPPLLFSQPSFTGRLAPSLSRNSSRSLGEGDLAGTASLGMLSHDSDSTPKARSFVGTPGSSFANTAPSNTRVLRSSRRLKEPRDTSDGETPTNSMIGGRNGSQQSFLLRQDSKSSVAERWEDAPQRLSRASTTEDEPQVSLLANPHNSEETNAELMSKYGHDNTTLGKYIGPLTPHSVPPIEVAISEFQEMDS
ncbi:hypothetical protein H072_8378 [Dactylellina haptotyla CBS 200.50]|uniref:Uncharacterized protein n=1 Tax=Dactylellina haptotyla (strain CBS 200.50) TaxID=1284197 RepID=S8A556_DACHA|nr:hypothetical protein H072_8378 [Dactylellina haptotyla CBS 200.50]